MSSHLLDSDHDARNHASFELKQLLQELHNNRTNLQIDSATQIKKKCSRGNSRVQRPKSSLLFDY